MFGKMLGRVRSCEFLGVWYNVGEGKILRVSGCLVKCWGG